MAVSFLARGVHGYYSASHAARFLPLIYEATRLGPGESIPLRPRNMTFNSLRMKLSYGRKFIEDATDYLYAPYSQLAGQLRLISSPDEPGLLRLVPTQKFAASAASFQPTELFSFFRLVDEWLASIKTSLTLTRRWEPPLAVSIPEAIETFVKSRPGIRSSSVSAALVVLFK